MSGRYQIWEWFGRPFASLSVADRQTLARAALQQSPPPACPFQPGSPPCGKKGGVCSIRAGSGQPVITCPKRFEAGQLLPRWLGRIAGFQDVYRGTEVPFMRSPTTGRAAGRIDIVVARDANASEWFGLEVQAVYFSGDGMQKDFELLAASSSTTPPEPTARRRPDWRSSSAKRLMPQLVVKAPTLRRWGTKLAVAVDQPFFDAIGGASGQPSTDFNDGDIIWLVARIEDDHQLVEHHWEVLSLEASEKKLLSAETVNRSEFEEALRAKLQRVRI